jgi:quinol-cytochrome oxidoreductase complex cytochrome b subunit
MYITLFVLIILCIFVFSFLLFHIYSIEKKQKPKNQKEKIKKPKQHLLPVESAVGLMKPTFQLAVAACQPAATQKGPATTIAVLPQVETCHTQF